MLIQKAISQVPEILRRLSTGDPAEGVNSFLREEEFSKYGQWGWEPPAPDDDDPNLPTSTGIMWAWEDDGSVASRARIFIPWPQEAKYGLYQIEVRL